MVSHGEVPIGSAGEDTWVGEGTWGGGGYRAGVRGGYRAGVRGVGG